MESTMIDKKYGDKPIHFEVSLGKLFVGGYWVIEIPLLINIDIRMRSSCRENHIGSVMVSMLASSVVDRRSEPWSGQTKYYEFGICCFSVNNTALKSNSKYRLALSQSMSMHIDMSTCELMFQVS